MGPDHIVENEYIYIYIYAKVQLSDFTETNSVILILAVIIMTNLS